MKWLKRLFVVGLLWRMFGPRIHCSRIARSPRRNTVTRIGSGMRAKIPPPAAICTLFLLHTTSSLSQT